MRVERVAIGAGHVQRRAERHDRVDARLAVQLAREQRERALAALGRADDVRRQARVLDHLARRARDQQLAVRDVGQRMAALGLVHVVRRHEHRHAFGGERVDLRPEVAPRAGIDARRGLVEQQELRRMQQARGERETLLPAAGQRARELLAAVREPEPLERALDGAAPIRAPRTRARRSRGSPRSTGPRRS